MDVAGQNTPSQFRSGVGSDCTFSNVAELYAHPLVDNYFFIGDNGGIRVMCMLFYKYKYRFSPPTFY